MGFASILAIIIATLIAVYNVLTLFGVFEWSRRPNKVVNEIEEKRKLAKKRRFETAKLHIYTAVISMFQGIFMSNSIRDNHEYYIQRLELRSEPLGRLYTPEEIRGKYAFFVVISFLFIPLGIFYPPAFAAPVIALALFFTYQTSYKMRIMNEDQVIDDYFIDLYLLLYSKLKQGSRARLQGTVENYIDSIESSRNCPETEVMKKFARYFLNLLAIYEDHVAVPHLRDYYHSATIINFVNIATQSLNGIDNSDNLLTFKMQLTERRTNLMRKRQAEILRKGERSILAIWGILAIFVVVGWYSKLPTGFF